MNVLVTGSTGFIGSHLCRALCEAGHSVRAFHRPSSPLRLLEGLDVEHTQGDLTRPETLQEAMQGVEVVFHAAAWMSSGEAGRLYAVTVEGTRELLAAAGKAGVRRVVHTSSVAALGIPEKGAPALLNENHSWNLHPEDYPYGYAKYLAEQEVQKAVAQGLDVVIVNPALVIGPGDLYRRSRSLMAMVAARKLNVAVEGGMNVVHVADVVEGHLAALERGQTGERYILGGENLSYLELMQKAARVANVPPPSLALPAWLVRMGRGPAGLLKNYIDLPVSPELFFLAGIFFHYDTRKASVELGLPAPRPVEQALAETLAWLRGG